MKTRTPSSSRERFVLSPWSLAWHIGVALISTFLLFSAGYWLARWLLHWLGLAFSTYDTVMILIGISLCLIALSSVVLRRFGASREHRLWQSLMDFISQMARGNFYVRLDPSVVGRQPPDHPIQQLVQSLNTMAADLGQLEVMRQEFIGNVSHEIQSPLASIAGFARILKTETISDQQRAKYLDIIHAESERLSRLTENLLQLSALESGSYPLHRDGVAIDRQIRECIVALEPLWMAKNLQIDVDLPAVRLTADPGLLNQVWVNLLTNAIKFTPANGTIRVFGEQSDAAATVRVADSGIGIDPSDQMRIFERFFKSDPARTRTTPGNGIGLAIVKKIIDLHDGIIAVESELERGTVVTVTLPDTFSARSRWVHTPPVR